MPEDPTPNDPPEPETDPTDPPANDPDPDDLPEDLGDAGKRAIQREREARKALEAKLKELEPLAAKARELEDEKKTEVERLTEKLQEATSRGDTASSEATALRMALKYGLEEDDLDLLGSGTEEQIEARAKRLAERAAPADPAKLPGRPRPRPRGGADPTEEPEETDPLKLAAKMPRH